MTHIAVTNVVAGSIIFARVVVTMHLHCVHNQKILNKKKKNVFKHNLDIEVGIWWDFNDVLEKLTLVKYY